MIPFDYEKTDEDRILAGKEMMNPVEVSEKSLERGAEAYEIFCVSCHGEKGDGQGYLFTSKRYPYPPASLISDKVKALPDGEIYHAITVGYGIMGEHGALIRQEDRWKIILHMRENLQK
jgi:cytochrome c